MQLRLADLLCTFRPESWGGTRGDTWSDHGRYLWAEDPAYMRNLAVAMHQLNGWLQGPVVVDDDVVQDGHHRIVTAMLFGWYGLPIPVVE